MRLNKKVQVISRFVVSFIWTLLTSVNAHSGLRGQEKGGGHPFEGQFKTAAIGIAQEILEIPEEFRKELRFSPEILLETARLMDSVCAEPGSEIYRELIEGGKLALYIGYDKDKVYLLCEPTDQQKVYELGGLKDASKLHRAWSEILETIEKKTQMSLANKVFFTHEILRNKKLSNENNYEVSGSILTAYFKWQQDRSRKALAMLTQMETINNCTVELRAPSNSHHYWILARQSDRTIFEIAIHGSILQSNSLARLIRDYPNFFDRIDSFSKKVVSDLIMSLAASGCLNKTGDR